MVFTTLLLTTFFVVRVTIAKNEIPGESFGYKSQNVTSEIRDDLIATAVAVQNCYRANHGADPLTLDPEISRVSQAWADRLAATGSFQHSGNPNLGENLFAASSITSGGMGIYYWYKEYLDSNYVFGSSNPSPGSAGHFTQVVWKGSQRVGFGVASSPSSRMTYFVANYAPPGNYQGQYASNVGPPRANVVESCLPKGISPDSFANLEIQIL